MWFSLAAVATLVWIALRWKAYADPRTGRASVPLLTLGLAKAFAVALGAAFVLTFLFEALVVVPPGHKGVVFDATKGVLPTPLKEGVNFIVPFVQEATMMDTRMQKFETDATAASKDLQIIHARVAVNIFPLADQVAAIYQEVGTDYADKIVAPAVQEVIKASTARYTAEELITRREAVKDDIHHGLLKALDRARLKLVATYITEFEFSQEFAKAIEQKQVAEQQALQAQRELIKVKIEAQQKVATAQAEAESLKMQKAAISGPLVELRRVEMQKLAIEKWDGNMPRYLLTGTVPILDLSKPLGTAK